MRNVAGRAMLGDSTVMLLMNVKFVSYMLNKMLDFFYSTRITNSADFCIDEYQQAIIYYI